jgi:hypothetical protein
MDDDADSVPGLSYPDDEDELRSTPSKSPPRTEPGYPPMGNIRDTASRVSATTLWPGIPTSMEKVNELVPKTTGIAFIVWKERVREIRECMKRGARWTGLEVQRIFVKAGMLRW